MKYFYIVIVFFFSYSVNAQVFITSTNGVFREVTVTGSSFTYRDLPMCRDIGSASSITRFGDTIYNIAGSLTMGIIGQPNSCKSLGYFPISSGVALTIDKNGVIYFAGNELSTYDTRTKVFKKIGAFPNGYRAAGDLIFYKNELYMSAVPNILVKVDLNDISKSNQYMTLSASNVIGLANVAIDCNTNRVFGFASKIGGTDVLEIDIENKKELGIKCTLPFSVGDAASLTETGSILGVNYKDIVTKNVCSNVGGDGEFTINATGGSNNLIFTMVGGTSNTTGKFKNLSEGNYSIRIETKEGCSADTFVTIKKVDPPKFQSYSQAITCSGYNASLTLVASSTTSPTFWYTLNGSAEQPSNTFTNLGNGTYNVVVRDVDYCKDSTTANIVIPSKPPFFSSVVISTPFCGDNTGKIQVKLSPSYNNATISINNGTASSNGNFSNLSAGNYLISVFFNATCRFDTTIKIIDSTPPKPLVIIAATSPTCYNINNGNLAFTINGTDTLYKISFNGGRDSSLNSFTGLASGTYPVKIIDSKNCKWDTVAIVNPFKLIKPITTINLQQVNCWQAQSGSIAINTSGIEAPYIILLNSNSFKDSAVIKSITIGNYQYKILNNNNCAMDSGVASLVVKQPIINPINAIETSKSTCNTNSGLIKVITDTLYNTLTYSLNGFNFQSSSSFTNLSAGSYKISVVSPLKCSFDSSVVIMDSFTAKPQIIITTISPDCHNRNNGSVSLQLNGDTNPYSVVFNNGTSSFATNYASLASGTFPIKVIDQKLCSWDTFAVVPKFILLKPNTIIKTNHPTCYLPRTGKIDINVSGSEIPYHVDFNGLYRLNPLSVSNLYSGVYLINILNKNNCIVDSFKTELLLKPDPSCDTLYVPSAFTPNGDGKNESFKPFGGTLVKSTIFSIYNRFGALLFSTTDLAKGWDGKLNGTPQQAGVYVWQLQYTDSFGNAKQKSGTVILLR